MIDLENLTRDSDRLELIKISNNELIGDCDLIFLPDPQSRNFDLLKGIIASRAIILVVENELLMKKGAEMAFVMEGNRLRFALNVKELDKKGLIVGSKLLTQSKLY